MMISSSLSPLQSVYPVVVVYDGVLIFIRVCNFYSRFILDGIKLDGLGIVGRVWMSGISEISAKFLHQGQSALPN